MSLVLENATTVANVATRGEAFANVIRVGGDATAGVAPSWALVAVTKHVPGLFACSTVPLSVHPEVPPL